MAITATLALSQSPISFNQVSTANVTVSNSGASAVTVTGLYTRVAPVGGSAYSTGAESQASGLPAGFAPAITVPAGGSTQFSVSYLVFSPQVATSSSALAAPSTSYTVGCDIYTSDGSVTSPTAQALTITPLQLSTNEA